MNGYLLHVAPGGPGAHDPIAQDWALGSTHVTRRNLAPGIELRTWGRSSGDVHHSLNEGESLLILNGYVAESSHLPEVRDPQRVCDDLLAAFDRDPSIRFGREVAASMHGSFSIVYVRLEERFVLTVTDRLASRSLWKRIADEGLTLSSHAVAISQAVRERSYDPGALAAFLLYGSPVEPTKSAYAGITAQSEGTIASLDDRRVIDEVAWYRFRHEPDNQRSFGSWLDLASRRFIEAAERILRIASNPMLFLSGGVDSRLAGAALVAAGGQPLFVTLCDGENLELRVARFVARAFGGSHRVFIRDDEYYLRGLAGTMFESHGCYSWIHSHFGEAYLKLKDEHAIDGAVLGDLCEAFSKMCFEVEPGRRSLWTDREFITKFDELPLPNYRPANRDRTLRLLRGDVRYDAELMLQRDIRDRYSRAAEVSEDPLIVADYFFRWQAAPCIATFQMFHDVRAAGPERNLMFDRGLHELLEVLPSRMRCEKQMGAKLVHRLHPGSARVPDSNSLLPLALPLTAHRFAKKMRPKLGLLRRRFSSNTHRTTASWPHLPLLFQRSPAWREHFESLIFDESALPRDLFDRGAVETSWRNFSEGDLSLHGDLEKLIGFAQLSRSS